jgi:hypothetical protein
MHCDLATDRHAGQKGPMPDDPRDGSWHGPGCPAWRERDRIDWPSLKERIDVSDVARDLLGDPPKMDGSGRRWWLCPFHPDRDPSFCAVKGTSRWRCYGCGVRGDSADLVMRLERLNFPAAVRYLVSRAPGWERPEASWRPPSPRRPSTGEPRGFSPTGARELVEVSRGRLWSPEGEPYRRWLHLRGLTDATIRAAGLGWASMATFPAGGVAGRTFGASGIVIPWFDGDRLAMVKIRQPSWRKPKYVEVYRDTPRVYPSMAVVRPGAPLILVEGEFDAMVLGQEVGDLASVVTLGSASTDIYAAGWGLFGAVPIYAAHDADASGDRAAARWPSRAVRARPPEPDNDWTDARRAGVDLRRWWTDRMAGIATPVRFTAEEEDRQERAAIMEFDGGMTREPAERTAGIPRGCE